MNRSDVILEASVKCMQELFQYAVPSITWEDYEEKCKKYTNLYYQWREFHEKYAEKDTKRKEWEQYLKNNNVENWIGKSREECIGPRPYELYYLPRDVFKDIVDSYIDAYRIDCHSDLINTISTLKKYCQDPIIEVHVDKKDDTPGYKDYKHADNLVIEVTKILTKYDDSMDSEQGEEIVNKFFEFLDMAGNFYTWNYDLNTFNTNVYLSASPCTNKQTVIDNWKKYYNKDIDIDVEQIKKKFYGEELD